jgi:glycosyltransferase involved in cell wall biosynthesis
MPGASLIWTPAAFRELGQALRARKFDVVHAHCSIVSPLAFAAISIAVRAGLPTVATGHSILGGFVPTFRALDRVLGWTRWPVVFSGVSARVAQELQSLVAPAVVDVLPNAIDPAEWHVPQRAAGSGINLVSVMRLAPRKRGDVLLRAFQRARSQLPSGFQLHLTIAGDGSERLKLIRLADQLGIGDAVTFLGNLPVPEVKALLARSDAFILPSLLEAFGIAALEARATGLPVLAMQASGVSEFITHEEDGLLAKNDDDLAHQLQRLCGDHSLRRSITSHNRATPVQFTWERTLAAHLATYERAKNLSRGAAHSATGKGMFPVV